MKTLFIGIGNRFRHDDGAGPELAGRLRAENLPGLDVIEANDDVIRLLDVWTAYDNVVIADAVSAGEQAGTLYRRDALACPLPRHWFGLSSHQLGVVEAIELGRTMKRLPPRLMFVGIEGKDFTEGEGLTPQVARSLAMAIEIAKVEIGACPAHDAAG